LSYTTLWNVPDPLWVKLAPILPPDKPCGTVGRPALRNRQVLNGILYVLRTGCQWKSLKKEWFGASSSLHDRYQAWRQAGLFARIFQLMLEYYDQVKRIQWRWQAIDSKLVPAPLGGEKTGKNPSDRGKLGTS
jgi:putative transposase